MNEREKNGHRHTGRVQALVIDVDGRREKEIYIFLRLKFLNLHAQVEGKVIDFFIIYGNAFCQKKLLDFVVFLLQQKL